MAQCLVKVVPGEIVRLIDRKVARIDSDIDEFATSLIDKYCIMQPRYRQQNVMKGDLVAHIRDVLENIEEELGDDPAGLAVWSYFSDVGGNIQGILFCSEAWVDVDWRKGDSDLNIKGDLQEFIETMIGKSFDDEF